MSVSRVHFGRIYVSIQLSDGRIIAIPWTSASPKLRDASYEQRISGRIIGNFKGIHWDCLDEDISIAKLIEEHLSKKYAKGQPKVPMRQASTNRRSRRGRGA